MTRVDKSVRALKLLVTILVSVSLVALFFVSQSMAAQWALLVLVGAGVYFSIDRLFELLFKTHQKKLWYYEDAIRNEVFLQSKYPCIIINLQSLKVIELNRAAELTLPKISNATSYLFTDYWANNKEDVPRDWLNKLRVSRAYSSFVSNVRMKEPHGNYSTKLCTLTCIPLSESEELLGIIKIVSKSLLLSETVNKETNRSRLDIARHAAGMAYWELDVVNKQLFFCHTVVQLLGLDDSFTSPIKLDELQQRADTAIFNFILQAVKTGFRNNPIKTQKMIIDRAGNQSFVYMQAQYYDKEGVVVGSFLDITSIKQLEIKLRQREQQTNQLVDSIPEGIMVLQKSRVVYLNRAAQKLFDIDFSVDDSELLLADFVSDHDKTLLKDRIRYMLSGKKNSYGFTSFTLRKSDGEYFDAEVAVNLIIYEGIESVQFVVRDLTDVLRVKNALARANYRLSALSSKTLQLIEAERKQIAGELHDDVGQSLTAVLLATKWISRRIEDEKILSKISDIHQITSQSLDTVRNLSLLLRPAQLDSLGFSPAIKWQMEKLFSIDNINYEIEDEHFVEVQDKQAEIVGFRIVQESLTNIVKHARAKNVKVTLYSDDNVLIIQVSDDGVGFDVHAQSDSVGLINMKERVELAGGEFKIFSKPLLGTDIKVEIPLRNSLSGLDSF